MRSNADPRPLVATGLALDVVDEEGRVIESVMVNDLAASSPGRRCDLVELLDEVRGRRPS
jgi:hypothetical protein